MDKTEAIRGKESKTEAEQGALRLSISVLSESSSQTAVKLLGKDARSEKDLQIEPCHAAELFATAAKKVIALSDTNKDGYADKAELARLVDSNNLTGVDSQALVGLFKNFEKVRNLTKHEWPWSSARISVADAEKLGKMQCTFAKEMNQPVDFSARFNGAFDQFDAKKEKAASIIDQMPKADRQLVQDFQRTSALVTAAQLSAHSKELFADAARPLESIRADAVRQGDVGNCFFQASVAALAQSNPELIRKMIKANGDNTFTVTFPGAPEKPLTVAKPSEAELAMYNRAGEFGNWPAVLEKAYGLYLKQSRYSGKGPQDAGWTLAESSSNNGKGGLITDAMSLLTGADLSAMTVREKSREELANSLQKSFGEKSAAVAVGTAANLKGSTPDGFMYGHAYSVLGFKRDGRASGTVVVRDPRALADGIAGGTVAISLETFQKNFYNVVFELPAEKSR